MRKYLYIGLGGFFGAILRTAIKSSSMLKTDVEFPLDTLFINVFGSFLIALFLTLCIGVMEIDLDIRLGITSGFIGAFTTFSTVCKEVIGLLEQEKTFLAIFYSFISISLGIIAVYTGIVIGKKIILFKIKGAEIAIDKNMDEK
jgi:CrcB protein